MNDRHPLLARILHTYMGIVVSDTPLGVFHPCTTTRRGVTTLLATPNSHYQVHHNGE